MGSQANERPLSAFFPHDPILITLSQTRGSLFPLDICLLTYQTIQPSGVASRNFHQSPERLPSVVVPERLHSLSYTALRTFSGTASLFSQGHCSSFG